MTEFERESEVIEINTDITAPGASKKTNHTVTDLLIKKQHDQPEGAFTERNMNRSQQTWVKTFIQDVMDEKGQVLNRLV
jgi:hypothetical protein